MRAFFIFNITIQTDIYSALSGKRSYKESFEKDKVISIVEQLVDKKQIDKEIVRVLVSNYDEISDYVEQECMEILQNYNQLKERYQKIHKILNISH